MKQQQIITSFIQSSLKMEKIKISFIELIESFELDPGEQNQNINLFQSIINDRLTNQLKKTKSKMVEIIKTMIEDYVSKNQKIQIILIRCLITKLYLLNKSTQVLFENDEILTICIEISDLRQSASKYQISINIRQFLDQIIQNLSSLLRFFFILKQSFFRKSKSQKKSFLSFVDTQNQQKSDVQFEIIEKQSQNQSIEVLIDRYLKKQAEKLDQEIEVCRICANKIPLSQIKKHLEVCKKLREFKQIMNDNDNDIELNIESLKNKNEKVKSNKNCYEDQAFFKREIRKKINLLLKVRNQKQQRRRSIAITKNEQLNQLNFEDMLIEMIESRSFQNTEIQKILVSTKQNKKLKKQMSMLLMNSSENTLSKEMGQYTLINPRKQQKKHSLKVECISDSSSFSELSKQNFDLKTKNSLKMEKLQLVQEVFASLKQFQSPKQSSKQEVFQEHISLKSTTFNIIDFQFLKLLGSGAYGKVYLVRRKQTKDIYAIKIVKLKEQVDEKELKSIQNEHLIFQKIEGQHLVSAPFSFWEGDCHIFVLQYLPGGDLSELLKEEIYFDEEIAKPIIAEIILAIQHLHNYDIIHRDLKPDNLVFDRKGHLKLTDFGLSEFKLCEKLMKAKNPNDLKPKRKRRMAFETRKKEVNIIGTPDYIAPEIINQLSLNNQSIDWWSLGVITYQLLTGSKPFCGQTIEQVLDNINKLDIQWPQIGEEEGMISERAKDFIEKLLEKNFMNRLGSNGVQQIKNHSFFEGLEWNFIKQSNPIVKINQQKLLQLKILNQDKDLRSQVERTIDRKNTKMRKINTAKKQKKFVRFDVLENETLVNVQKIYQNHQIKAKKLRSLKSLKRLNTESYQKLVD